jgi:hypothetical protein
MSLRQLGRVCQRLETVRRQQVELLAERDALLAHRSDSGVSRSELTKAAGCTPGRVTQLLNQAQPELIASDE